VTKGYCFSALRHRASKPSENTWLSQVKKHSRSRAGSAPERSSKPKSEHDSFAERLRLVADSPYVGTVRALAAISGVKFESTVHAWLKDAEPKRDALKRIADAAHVSLDWLLTGEPYAQLRFYDLRESQGFNEVFLESAESSKPDPTLRWTTFDLKWLSGESKLGNQYIERWQNPMIATHELFAVRIAGSDGAMRPLIDDGDIAIVMRAGVPLSRDPVTAPVLLSREGKVLARLAEFQPDHRVTIGSVDQSSPTGAMRMGVPEQTLSPSPEMFVWPHLRIFGRIIWCGSSLLDIDCGRTLLDLA
jgi:transcriptional regulator with XRE-family HTH domain